MKRERLEFLKNSPNNKADFKLDEGLDDVKKPYHPDFGYPLVELEPKKPGWNILAENIIQYPKHSYIQNLIKKSEEEH